MKKYLALGLLAVCIMLQLLGCSSNDYRKATEEQNGIDFVEMGIVPEDMENTETDETDEAVEGAADDNLEQKKELREAASTESEDTLAEAEKNTTDEETEKNWEVPAMEVENYVYGTLDTATQQVYHELLEAILAHKEKVEVSTVDLDILENAYEAIFADHGGLFWVSGYAYTQYSLGGKLVSMEVSPQYTMELQERESIQKQIDAVAAEFLAGISVTDTDYDKAKYVFETLIRNVEYDTFAENNQNIISVFLNRSTVCQGYACATQYLLEKTGIQSAIVKGNANGGAHGWNLIRLDGKYYYMDTTWGNSRYKDADSGMDKYVNYSYLALSAKELRKTHRIDVGFALPECNSMEHNYFVREGLYFREWQPEKIGSMLSEIWDNGGGEVALKFSIPSMCEMVIDYFVKEQHVADYCETITTIYYLCDEEQNVVIFQI